MGRLCSKENLGRRCGHYTSCVSLSLLHSLMVNSDKITVGNLMIIKHMMTDVHILFGSSLSEPLYAVHVVFCDIRLKNDFGSAIG